MGTTAHRLREQGDTDEVALDLWTSHEDRLFGVAYRMLGSVTDSQDVLQDAFLRLGSVDPTELRRPGAWLTTVVTRLCLNHLDTAKVRRESYVGPWLPEPVATAPDPEQDALVAESVSAAFLVVLEALSPAERAAFVLHDVFGRAFADVADVLGCDEAAARQLASRARKAIHDDGTLAAVLSVSVDDRGQVETVAMVVNPDKFRHLDVEAPAGWPDVR